MSNKVIIEIDDTSEIGNFLQQLNNRNLVNDIDFTWMYEPTEYDDKYAMVHPKRVTFFFTESRNATWFMLTH